jgi:putative flippase GtrA
MSGKIVRFACVGIIVAMVFAGLNALFGRVFGLGPQVSFLTAYPPALALHFLLNKIWAFGDRTATTHHQLGEYSFSVIVNFLIQWSGFLVFQKALGMPGWAAAFGTNLLQMPVSFALLRWRVFHGKTGVQAASTSNPWHRIALLGITLGGLSLIYWTSMGSWTLPQFERSGGGDYYNLLVAGFRKGTLAMDVPVPEAFAKAENPWDPGKRPPGIALHDASYFNGHYYLYFGVVPAVLLFWPFHALTGFPLPFGLAAIFFLIAAYLLSLWLWLEIVRERFPRAGILSKLAGPLILGLCGGQLVLARRSSIWEMPIAGGHFFMVCLAACAYLAFRARKPWVPLAGAGLALGLAIGCRPTLAGAGPALAYLVVKVGWLGVARRARILRFLKSLLSAGIPFAAVVAGLLAYNWRRFGAPLEFGLNYQLTGNYEAKVHHFQVKFAPFNLESYFLRSPQWGRYFPFLHPPSWIPQPAGYYGMEFVYGALVVCPVIYGAILAIGILRRRETVEAAMVIFFLIMAVGTTSLLVCFNTAAARYVPDFLPWWLWLALIGWVWLESVLRERRLLRTYRGWAFSGVYAVCIAASLVLAFVQSAALHGVLVNRNPTAYRQISRVLDYPAAGWERLAHERSGPVTMDVTFPAFHGAVLEPILVTGVEYEADYFFVYYKAPGIIRLGFANSGDSPVYSGDIRIEPGKLVHLRFEGGALYPPDGHPIYSGWTEGQVRNTKSWLRIGVEGRLVVSQPRQFQDGAPEFLQVGRDIRSAAFGRLFTGTASNVRRESLRPEPTIALSEGDVVLKVTLPEELVPGSQPLLVAGKPGSAELVGYRQLDEKRFVLTYEKWGGGYWESNPLSVPESGEATFRIRLGSILPAGGRYPLGIYSDLLIVWMDGLPVWWRHAFGDIGSEPPVEVMVNSVGSSAMRPLFQGNLLSLHSEPVPTLKPGAFRSLELDLAGRGTGVEPLVVTGVPGRADLLAIEWLPDNKARLLLDHWSFGGFSSPVFAWDAERMHHLKVTLPSFAALDSPAISSGIGKLTVEVDGRLIWEQQVPFYGASSATFAFGKNTVGSSVALASIACRLGDIRQDFADR